MTHMALRIVVEADSIDEAVAAATTHFEERLMPDSTFDYCKPMEAGRRVAGSDRFEQYQGDPLAFEADRPKAMREIRDAFKATQGWWARLFVETVSRLCRMRPEMMRQIVVHEATQPIPDDDYYEEFMGLLDRELYEDRITNPDRVDEVGIVSQDDIDALMYDRFSRMRSAARRLGRDQYVYCYLYDTTYYSDGSGSAIDTVEQFEEIYDTEHLDGKYVVPLDAHH